MQEQKENHRVNQQIPPICLPYTKLDQWTTPKFVEWVTPKPKPEVYKPGQEVKQVEVHQVQTILDHLDEIQISKRVREHTNSYFPILFRKVNCRFYTPLATVPFPLSDYSDPKSKVRKWSVHLCMDDSTQELYNLNCLVQYLDTIACKHYNMLKEEDLGFKFNDHRFTKFKYYSPLRENRKDISKPKSLRIKMPSKNNIIIPQIYNGDELLSQDIEVLKKYITTGTKVKCILEVNPIWYGTYTEDYKYGISFKLIALKIERPKIDFP